MAVREIRRLIRLESYQGDNNEKTLGQRMMANDNTEIDSIQTNSLVLSEAQRILILIVAFLGWMFAGTQMSINGIVHFPAAVNLLGPENSGDAGKWAGLLVCAFLFGAAAGGYVFGWVGDRFGRAKAMAISIACYSIFSFLSTLSPNVEIFWVLRFITCMGIGGMWPNGMALIQEAWPNTAKPILAGILGTSANVGIMLFSLWCMFKDVNTDDWHWTLQAGGLPILLAIFTWFCVPESPSWLAEQHGESNGDENVDPVTLGEVFNSKNALLTFIGIVLAFVPLFGGWGVANWANYWAAEYDQQSMTKAVDTGMESEAESEAESDTEVAQAASKKTSTNLKAEANFHRAWPGSISSLLGGALAFYLGRRFSYALLCVLAFACTQFLYALPDPTHTDFLFWVKWLGFFSGFFFGWLPLCLPEMFDTRIRSTGSGVSFNFGRIIVGVLIIATSWGLKELFEGRYDTVGRICGFMYLLGIVAVLMIPKSTAIDDKSAAVAES